MSRDKTGAVWAGLGLIGLGAALVLGQWIDWERIWPTFLFSVGVAFVAACFAGGA